MKQIMLYLFPTMSYKWEVFAFFLKDEYIYSNFLREKITLKLLNTENSMYFLGVHMATLISQLRVCVHCVCAPLCACLCVFVHI